MSSKTAKNHSSDLIKGLLKSIPEKQKEQTKRKMLLAAKIGDALKAKGWSQTDLADRLGKYPSEVTKWLSGTHNFTIETLWEIQDLLNIRLIDLEVAAPELVQILTANAVAHSSVAETLHGALYPRFVQQTYRIAEVRSHLVPSPGVMVTVAGFWCDRSEEKKRFLKVASLHG